MRPASRTDARPWRRGLLPALFLPTILACNLMAAAFDPAWARDDFPGWDRTRWGMTAAEIDKLYGAALQKVEPPIEFGSSAASRIWRELDFAGFAWRALFQFDRESHGLVQVMLQRSRLPDAPKAYEAALAALQSRYGPPDLVCGSPGGGASSSAQARERVWRLPTSSIHLVFLDIGGGELQYNVFDWPPTPSQGAWPQRFHGRGGYPQRLLIRYHPTARNDLFLPGCGR